MNNWSPLLFSFLGLIIGAVLAWLICRSRSRRLTANLEAQTLSLQETLGARERDIVTLTSELDSLRMVDNALTSENATLLERLYLFDQSLTSANDSVVRLQEELAAAVQEKSVFEATLAQGIVQAETMGFGRGEQTPTPAAALVTAPDIAGARLIASERRSAEVEELTTTVLLRTEVARLQRELAVAQASVGGNESPEQALAALRKSEQSLAEANAQIASLRSSLSVLSAVSAELAMGLDKRNKEYDRLLSRVSGIPLSELDTEVDVETLAQASSVDVDGLQYEIEIMKANLEIALNQKADLEAQLDQRAAALDYLNSELEQSRADFEAATTARINVEEQLQARTENQAWEETQARLAALQAEIEPLKVQMQELVGEEAVNVEETDEHGHKIVSLSALAASVAGVKNLIANRDAALDEANAQVASLQEQLALLTAAKIDLDAAVGQQSEEAAQLQTQIGALQTDLEAATADRSNLEMSLQARETELAAVQAQVEALTEETRVAADEREAIRLELQAREAEFAEAQTRLANSTAMLAAAPAVADVARWFAGLPANKQIAANAAVLEGALPRKALRVQKLSEVKGIGTVFEQRLYDAGLGTFWEVAHLPDEEFQQILEVPDWQMMLLDLDAIREDALQLARETDTVGTILENLEVDDFERIPGIGPVYERRLYEADIHTYEALASISVEDLAVICHTPRTQAPDYASWIAQARRLAESSPFEP